MRIQDRTFMITGGGSGLGAATARLLAAAGANVVVADSNAETGTEVAADIGSQARFVLTNTVDEESVRSAVQTALSTFGGLHGAVNCAETAIAEKTLSRNGPHPLGSFARLIQINLMGTFNVIRLAAAVISQGEPDSEGERGVIINTSSIAAFDGQIGQAAYAASMAGIAGMTLPIARELAEFGIRVVTIAPGMFDTPLMRLAPESMIRSWTEQLPFPKRMGRPNEFGALVKHAIENGMLNGEVIRLDGSLRLQRR